MQNVSWQNKRAALKQSPHSDCEIHSENGLSPNALREPQSVVKKRSADPLYHVPDIDKKRKRNGTFNYSIFIHQIFVILSHSYIFLFFSVLFLNKCLFISFFCLHLCFLNRLLFLFIYFAF